MEQLCDVVCTKGLQHEHVVHQHIGRAFGADELVLWAHMGVLEYALAECFVAQGEDVANGMDAVLLEQLHHLSLGAFPHFAVLSTLF